MKDIVPPLYIGETVNLIVILEPFGQKVAVDVHRSKEGGFDFQVLILPRKNR
jgi:hypothetical protein